MARAYDSIIVSGKEFKFTGVYKTKTGADKMMDAIRNSGGKATFRRIKDKYSPAKDEYRVYYRY